MEKTKEGSESVIDEDREYMDGEEEDHGLEKEGEEEGVEEEGEVLGRLREKAHAQEVVMTEVQGSSLSWGGQKGKGNDVLYRKIEEGAEAETELEVDTKVEVEVEVEVGDVVSISFDQHVRRLLPARPRILRVRHDRPWKDILACHQRDLLLNGYLFYSISLHSSLFLCYFTETDSIYAAHSQRVVGAITTPVGFWMSEKGRNMRRIFEKFAQSCGFDPLTAEDWYKVPRSVLLKLPVRSG